jgi:opacity protein-like surface antigen
MKVKAIIAGAMMALMAGPALAEQKWTGVYAGVFGGMDMAEIDFGAPIGINERNIGYGVTVGGDFQFPGTALVLGIAADHAWTDGDALKKHWSVTGRAGFVVGNAMPYALAGYKKADFLGTDLDGWVAGAGIEFAVIRNVYLGGEYRFTQYDLPSGVPSGIDLNQHEVRATLKIKTGGLF